VKYQKFAGTGFTGFLAVILILTFSVSVGEAADQMRLFSELSALQEFVSQGQAINIAHRGARSLAPENTLQAFEIALRKCEARMVELDVHLSSDGIPFVFHDDDLRRCTDAETVFPGRENYLIGFFSSTELCRLNAGQWFVRTDPFGTISSGEVTAEMADSYIKGVRIPTLASALRLIGSLNGTVNIEIKNFPSCYNGIEQKVIDLIHSTGMNGRTVISSFDHESIIKCRMIDATIPTAALCEQPIAGMKQYFVKHLGCVCFNPGKSVLGFESIGYIQSGVWRKDLVAEAHRAGLAVFVWTVNDPVIMEKLISSGIDGIFTDFPQRLAPLLKK
jgi:glycerophosphoryl diester phosphodiesterase